jgi:cell fate regulator YaaT (PSP1 superfamily)
MSDYRDTRQGHAEEELRHLEDEPSRLDEERGRSRALSDPKDLPRPLYRIRATHSNETFFAYFPEGVRGPDPAPGTTASEEGGDEVAPSVEAPSSFAGSGEPGPAEAAPEASPAEAESSSPAEGASGLEPELPEAPAEAGPSPAAAALPAEAGEGRSPAELGKASRVMVVAPTRYGRDLCELQGVVKEPGPIGRDDLVRIERIATPEDRRKSDANLERERKAYELCKQKIGARNLPMKLVSAHYLLEEPKVLFYFSAESRVDFRELVKDLVSVFKMRIELRQIGVRDEARVTGGCGVCGRVLCCHGVTDKLVPVSIKMAKDQNLSLNSMKISGPCGRLLCCLAYEYGFYRDARRELPNEGARFQYDGTLFRVVEVNPLAGKVKMSGEDGRVLDMPAARFAFAEGRWQVKEEEKEE